MNDQSGRDAYMYPPDFTTLVKQGYVKDLKIFVSPIDLEYSSKLKKLSPDAAINGENSSFIYLGRGLSDLDCGRYRYPLVIEAPWLVTAMSNSSIFVLYSDFSISKEGFYTSDPNTKVQFTVVVDAGDESTALQQKDIIPAYRPIDIRKKNCKWIVRELLMRNQLFRKSNSKIIETILANAAEVDETQRETLASK